MRRSSAHHQDSHAARPPSSARLRHNVYDPMTKNRPSTPPTPSSNTHNYRVKSTSPQIPKKVVAEDSSGSSIADRREVLPEVCVDIYVENIDATKQFYALAFGISLQNIVLAGVEAAATFNLYDRDLVVRWIQRQELFGKLGVQAKIVRGMTLKIEVEDIWYTVARAWEAGAVTIEGEEYETPHRSVVSIRDPNGVTIDLIKIKLTSSQHCKSQR